VINEKTYKGKPFLNSGGSELRFSLTVPRIYLKETERRFLVCQAPKISVAIWNQSYQSKSTERLIPEV